MAFSNTNVNGPMGPKKKERDGSNRPSVGRERPDRDRRDRDRRDRDRGNNTNNRPSNTGGKTDVATHASNTNPEAAWRQYLQQRGVNPYAQGDDYRAFLDEQYDDWYGRYQQATLPRGKGKGNEDLAWAKYLRRRNPAPGLRTQGDAFQNFWANQNPAAAFERQLSGWGMDPGADDPFTQFLTQNIGQDLVNQFRSALGGNPGLNFNDFFGQRMAGRDLNQEFRNSWADQNREASFLGAVNGQGGFDAYGADPFARFVQGKFGQFQDQFTQRQGTNPGMQWSDFVRGIDLGNLRNEFRRQAPTQQGASNAFGGGSRWSVW